MKLMPIAACTILTAAAVLSTAGTASATTTQDTACMRNGMNTLKSLGLFSTVAREGLPVSTALAAGVTVRPGADISGVPSSIPLSVLLADHRAGDRSLFVYPWC